jgi:predicted phage gp36 major capsid-like protein
VRGDIPALQSAFRQNAREIETARQGQGLDPATASQLDRELDEITRLWVGVAEYLRQTENSIARLNSSARSLERALRLNQALGSDGDSLLKEAESAERDAQRLAKTELSRAGLLDGTTVGRERLAEARRQLLGPERAMMTGH